VTDIYKEPEVKAVNPHLPLGLLFRWFLSAILVLVGAWRLFSLFSSWSYWAERTIIDAAYSPWGWLRVELCIPISGVLLALRSRWVFVPVIIHIVLFLKQMYVGRLHWSAVPYEVIEIWFFEALVLSQCIWLWLKRGLR
jgi:hypothetical protein